MATGKTHPQIPLGSSVPAHTPHAISVSLPLWEDNIGYEEGDKRVVDKMETGYPRFFVHRSIQKVSWLGRDEDWAGHVFADDWRD